MAVLRAPLICASAATMLLAGTAAGEELCVKCKNPNANYACVVNTTTAGTIDTVVKLYCITALAKAGSHESCAIDRNSQPPCAGERKELSMPSAVEQALDSPLPETIVPSTPPQSAALPGNSPPPPQSPSQAATGAAPQPPKQAAGEAPPRTVQEMVEKSAQSAGDTFSDTQKSASNAAKSTSTALEKAGSAVGNAAKSSWKCLSSFFSNC